MTTPQAQVRQLTWRDILRGRDIVIISPQFWGDLWVSKHWIAHELSHECRVLFVEPALWLKAVMLNPRRWKADIPNALRRARSIKDNLTVCSPLLYPRAMGPNVQEQVARVARRLGFRDPIVLNFDTNYKIPKALAPLVNVYYCVDPVMSPLSEENDERRVCIESDLIYAISDTYREQLMKHGSRAPIHVIPHGYAYEHARSIDENPEFGIPPELRELPRPILGFVGSIHDSYVDIDRLERISAAFPEGSIVMIGPHRNNPIGPDLSPQGWERIKALPNVHLLGPRHFLEVPKYVKHFDVGLVLINTKDFDNTAKTSKRTLFKWLLYLAMGKPAIAPMMSEALPINRIVYLCRNDAEYVSNIEAALAEPVHLRQERISYASQFSFDNMLNRIAGPMRELLQ